MASMHCPDCGSEMVAFAVPDECREYAPESRAALCGRCLAVRAAPAGEAAPEPDFEGVSEAFPTGEAAIPMALALGLLESLALHRRAVEALFGHVERAGVDPLLTLDRLAADPALDPRVDLRARRRQVQQFR